MALRKIIPDVVDTLPPDPRDDLTKEIRRQRLERLDKWSQSADMPGPPALPGLHVFQAPRGVSSNLAAGRWAYLYHLTGRTVISNAELLYGYCPDGPLTDGYAFLAQAPDDSVVYLVEMVSQLDPDQEQERRWSNLAVSQVMEDAAARGVTILYLPVDATLMRSALKDSTRWVHQVSRPAVMVETIPHWSQIEEQVHRRSRNPLFEPDAPVANPAGPFSYGMAINVATAQSWDRPDTLHEEALDPHDRLDVGHLSADDAYRQMVERFRSRLGLDFTAEDLMREDWGSLLRKTGKR